MEFMDLNPSFGKTSVSYEDITWLSLDLEADFGVTNLDPDSLSDFRNLLQDDYDLSIDYLVAKMGFDPTNQDEVDQALAIYADKDLITSKKHKTDEYICQMHKSLTVEEYETCCGYSDSDLFIQWIQFIAVSHKVLEFLIENIFLIKIFLSLFEAFLRILFGLVSLIFCLDLKFGGK